LIEKALRWPSTIKTPKKIFVASMSDPFHECLPTGSTKAMFEAMGLAYWHTYMLLTKRPRRAQEKLTNWMDVIDQYRDISDVVILRKNIWPGISCSTQRDFDAARMLFNGAGFHVPWVSLEPLCEPIDISIGRAFRWVVIGGETGPRARPCEIEWIRAIVQQCKEAGMPCFVKQLGGRRHKNDSPDEWPEDLRVREWPDTKK
jgi:protein gp37